MEPSETLRILVQQHARFLGFLIPRIGSREAAEDLLQAAFVRVLAQKELPADTGVLPWFYRLLRNALVDHYRHQGAELRALERHGSTLSEAWEPQLEAQLCGCLEGLLETLPPQDADLLRRVEFQGNKVSDVAPGLGLSANAATVRLHRARKALKARLIESCGTCTEHGCLDCTCQQAPPKVSL